MSESLTRRDVIRVGVAGMVVAGQVQAADNPIPPARPFLTPAEEFTDVSRGNPMPHSLTGKALTDARLTAETWRLEIVAEDKATLAKPRTLEANTAFDYAALVELGKKRSVRFLKAMQCNTIATPLGQGLWEGVPLRDVLESCGRTEEVRRLFYWGFHNNDPKQIFRSSLPFNQVLDTPPGELPPFLAYKLNGEPIPLTRGGPVRMVVPWAHGFKSIKWLQKIVLTNRYDANDTYAEQGNDPESYLKTAAYFDDASKVTIAVGKPLSVHGTAMVGWPGLERVEYRFRKEGAAGQWQAARIEPPPSDWAAELPGGVMPKDVWGFTAEGKPKEWPMRFSLALWTVKLDGLQAGSYEICVRTIDKNGFAQPEPRSGPHSGRNRVPCKKIIVE